MDPRLIGIQTHRPHGIQHGGIFISLTEGAEPIEGQWIHVDKETASPRFVNAFDKMQKAMEDIHTIREDVFNLFDQVAEDDANEAGEDVGDGIRG